MMPKILLAAALELALPSAARAQEPARPWYPPYTYPAPYAQGPVITQNPHDSTQLRVVPAEAGAVFVFDGSRLIGRFDQPGSLNVESGRSYVVVAIQSQRYLWGGDVPISGPSLQLSFRQQAAPGWTYGQGQPPAIERYGYRGLLDSLDRQYDDRGRLDILRTEAQRDTFTTEQAHQILERFRSEPDRLEALKVLRNRLVDQDNRFQLTRHFRQAETRRQAIDVLHHR
jgi:hypothetical protein